MNKLLFSLFFLLVSVLPARAELVSKIAAVVNDDIITTYQLEQEVARVLAKRARGEKLNADQIETLRRTLLDKLIEETLLQQQIEALGLTVSETEIDEAVQDVQRQNKLTTEQLTRALKAQGLTMESYREKLRKQILRLKLLGRQVQSKVDVTDSDIREYFRDHIDEFREPPYIRFSHLIVTLPEKADARREAEARELAEKALARLRGGESLESVVEDLSRQGLAIGGDMGRFKESELSPEIVEALKGMKVGDYSRPLKVPRGFMIFRVDERIPGHIRNFDLVKSEIRQKLIDEAREREFRKWSKSMKKDAYIDIRL
ncbi:periplasmic chaperone for outer membrane proteins SurA [Geothermobacter ehrlichii]|uniref:Periplasmic chaperone for outer membrane proteins SurA n=1 Tax=Geothermobacter ehrlichii TaxID=213224 RepID=A0A5D3WHR7_9BACT|nr:peptidyl-prolyl cis-trans isomerase [Geothermobacter ehrlichii]TYO97636.1 periplasmic chaperone for outer membrane proteins SurA [Geothermobacter ehrlichii]